jgi:hypothetical protein
MGIRLLMLVIQYRTTAWHFLCTRDQYVLKIRTLYRNYLSTGRKSVTTSVRAIVTDYGLDSQGIEFQWGEIFRLSRPALGPTQPTVQWVLGLSRGVKYGWGMLLTTHPLLVPWSWKSRTIPLPTLWATTTPVTGTLYRYMWRQSHFYVKLS